MLLSVHDGRERGGVPCYLLVLWFTPNIFFWVWYNWNETAEINQMNEPCQFSIMLCFLKTNLSCCVYKETHLIRKATCNCAIFTKSSSKKTWVFCIVIIFTCFHNWKHHNTVMLGFWKKWESYRKALLRIISVHHSRWHHFRTLCRKVFSKHYISSSWTPVQSTK